MRLLLEGCFIAFSLFSRLPVPQVTWNEKNMRTAVLFLPAVGILIGLSETALLAVANAFSFPYPVTALLFLALPVLVTGGIHLDGLIDTADARHSFGDPEKKQQILKDPHVGAFGVIRLLLYLMLMTALLLLCFSKWEAAGRIFAGAETVMAVTLPFVLSRALTAFSVVSFPKARKDGIAHSLAERESRGRFMAALIETILSLAAVLPVLPVVAALVLIASELMFLLFYRRFSKKSFGGVSGDLSGWFLCLSELIYAAVAAGAALFPGA